MLIPRGKGRDGKCGGLVAVAVDKGKSSHNALKWATDTLVSKGQTIMLIHVRTKGSFYSFHPHTSQKLQPYESEQDPQMKEFILPFKCFCTRKDIDCKDAILEDTDIAKALLEYVTHSPIQNLVMGTPSRNVFLRKFKMNNIPASIAQGAPDFCNVYIITKGKAPFIRTATRPVPLHNQIQNTALSTRGPRSTTMEQQNTDSEAAVITSPFTRGRAANGKLYGETSMPENDISFVGDGGGTPITDRTFTSFYKENMDMRMPTPLRASSLSKVTENSIFEPLEFGRKSSSHHQIGSTTSLENFEDIEAEMRKLQMELMQTKYMYSTACKEADTANQKAKELQVWKVEEEGRLRKAISAEEAALEKAAKEKVKSRAAIERANAAKRIAEHESQKRVNAEIKAVRESEEKKRALNALANSEVKYRKYSIEEIEIATNYFAEEQKIGEGGYGPVYKCFLDHTDVAIKVLRPEATQGRSQFQQEVEVLSCIRHPNMVLLLGACPEYGCLVYEYMANGSLDDCLFKHHNSPPLPWQLRFRIASEIGTGLLFLHQTKPEPLVHRDLKPANILLDQNYISKISDVGLSRLVPPLVADAVTQYRMTSTAGTFCYIDPEYQQTGMLGIKSDVYSLGIMLLQLITAQPPMGLSHHVEGAIEKGTFSEMLDPSVPDWPFEEALSFASISLRCAELRRKDRPDLGKVVVPELNRLRVFAEENMDLSTVSCEGSYSQTHSKTDSTLDTSSNVTSDFADAKTGSSI